MVVSGTVDVIALQVNYTVTIDTIVDGWTFANSTLSGQELVFNLVTGQPHEWTASFSSSQVSGDLVINVLNASVIAGIFYVDPTTMVDHRLDNVPIDQGTIENLGFQTEIDATQSFQAIEDQGDPYVVTSDLLDYVRTSALPIAVSRGETFPTAPVDGDEHYLTTDIYPPGTTFNPNPTPVSETRMGTAAADFPLTQVVVNDPVTNTAIVAGTVQVTQANVPLRQSSH